MQSSFECPLTNEDFAIMMRKISDSPTFVGMVFASFSDEANYICAVEDMERYLDEAAVVLDKDEVVEAYHEYLANFFELLTYQDA